MIHTVLANPLTCETLTVLVLIENGILQSQISGMSTTSQDLEILNDPPFLEEVVHLVIRLSFYEVNGLHNTEQGMGM